MEHLSILKRQSLSALVLLTLATALGLNLLQVLPKKSDLTLIYRNPTLSYDLKMRLKIGTPLYEYLIFLQRNLPIDAIVAEPPQMHPWAYTGNGAFLNYFLYPRRLVQVNLPTDPPPAEATHSLLVWGDSFTENQNLYGWPKIDLSTYEIIYMQKDPPWGIVKLKP